MHAELFSCATSQSLVLEGFCGSALSPAPCGTAGPAVGHQHLGGKDCGAKAQPLLAMHEGADVPLNHHEQHVAPLSAGVIRDEGHKQMKPQNVSRRTGLCLLSPGGPGPGLWGRSPGRLELDLEQLLKSGQAPAWASRQAQEEPPRNPQGCAPPRTVTAHGPIFMLLT